MNNLTSPVPPLDQNPNYVFIRGYLPSSPLFPKSTYIKRDDLVNALQRALNTWPDAPEELFHLHASLTILTPELLANHVQSIQKNV